jgi:ATP-dependent helicase YprA (DUF1998 family)
MVKRHKRRESEGVVMGAGIGEHEAAIDRLGTPVPLPTEAAVGERVIGRILAVVEHGLTRLAARRRRGRARRREGATESLAAGLSRGLTLFVDDRGTPPRREEDS